MDEARGQSLFNDRILLDRGKGGLGNSLKGQRAEKEKEQELDRIPIVYFSWFEGRRRGRGRNHAEGTGRPGTSSPQWVARFRQRCISRRECEGKNRKAARKARGSGSYRWSQNGQCKRESI